MTLGYDDPDGLMTQAGALSLTPHPSHGLLRATALGTVSDSREYNAFGELRLYEVVANGTERFRVEIPDPAGRDALGRIVETQEWLDGVAQPVRTYEYDPAGRLWRVRENGTLTAEYTYDANGNRLTAPNLVGPAGYDDQDRLMAYGALAYTYTPNGDLATKAVGGQVTTYGYDALGNLRTVGLPTGPTLEYLIDGQNRRVGKVRDGVLEQVWLWEDQLRVAAQLDVATNVVTRFVYGTRVNVPEYLVRHPGVAGQEATYRLVTDHLGSPRLVINTSDGTVVQWMDYDEFGRVLLDTNPGFQPFGFAGGLYDRDTGLVRFGVRDYDAATGRWTAKDPQGFRPGDTNLFNYGLSDPLNRLDPDGENPIIVAAVAAAAVSVAAVGVVVYGTLECARHCVGGDIRQVGQEACDTSAEPDPERQQRRNECIARTCGPLSAGLLQLVGFTDPFNTIGQAIGQAVSGESLP